MMTEMTKDSYIYLYCVTETPPALPPVDTFGNALYWVKSNRLYATVGKVPADEFGQDQLEKKLNEPEWLKRQVEKHEQVIEAVMHHSVVIPSKFATVFFCERNVQTFLEQYEGALTEKLSDLSGREEWGVKVYCNESSLLRHVVENNPEVIDIDHEINSASPGKAYLLKRKRQQLIENAITNNMNIYRKLFLEVFQSVCPTVLVNPLTPREATDRDDGMILNLALLVEQEMLQDFLKSLETLKKEFGRKGFAFDGSGPWPPYNFSKITVT